MIRTSLVKFFCYVLIGGFSFAGQRSILAADPPAVGRTGITIRTVDYHGWPNSLILGNDEAEVVVVPAIGRIMQFRPAGATTGPFWENSALNGRMPDPASPEWLNFGGDKAWPAPQADWPKVTGRAWPPPPAFDSMPHEARIDGNAIELISPVDPFYGIRIHRRIWLDSRRSMMLVTTRFEKVQGPPQTVSIWVVTQFKEPALACARVPLQSIFPDSYVKLSDALPRGLQVDRRFLSLARDPAEAHKIGLDSNTLGWVGPFQGWRRRDLALSVRIDSPRVPGAEYPDHQSNAQIYTNPNPLAYVELEMLGPLKTLHPGDEIERTSIYSLFTRRHPDPRSHAENLLGIQ